MNQNLAYVLNHNSICIVNGIIVSSNLELTCRLMCGEDLKQRHADRCAVEGM
jgi:hypothetical protein